MSIEIAPLRPEHLPRGAEILAGRWRGYRSTLPLLPERFEQPEAAQRALEAMLARRRAVGVAALRDGALAGYLIGHEVIAPPWGRTAWVRFGGCAIAPGASHDLVADLYAALGAKWVADGCFAHFILAPAMDPAMLQAWFGLSFGIEQVHALGPVPAARPAAPAAAGLEIRRAEPNAHDRAALAGMSHLLRDQMTAAPVWAAALPESADEMRAGYAGMVDDADAAVWLAHQDGRAAGFVAMYEATPADDALLVGEGCVELSIAATVPELRGQGVNTALTCRALDDALARGKRACLIDWRSANRLAARFWPRFGFQPAMLRLARRLDERIAWAHGRAA